MRIKINRKVSAIDHPMTIFSRNSRNWKPECIRKLNCRNW
jgi:hypothetical protein